MSDKSLFREVDEEVRQEQFKKLWKQYGNAFVALALVVVVGVAGFKGWQYWQHKQAEVAGDTFFAAVKLAGTGKTDEALKQFEAIGHPGYAQLARLREAALLAASGKVDAAVKNYDAIAADGSTAAPLRELARVRAAYALADTATPADLAERLKGFEETGNVWRHASREIKMLAAWRTQDYAGTETQVKAILGDTDSPGGLRQRAQMLADLLVPLLGQK